VDTKQVVDLVGASIELAGIVVLVTGAVLAFLLAIKTLFYKRDASVAYRALRRGLGKAILIGLELLVAADIIRSVAISPSFATIGVLGMIVVIRTFLSWSLELEINGSWPWQGPRSLDDVESRHS
jgi:uncharacterized membrane protein